jgi:hypothetical protein
MSFDTDIYPLRTDRSRFTEALLSKYRSEWRNVVRTQGASFVQGGPRQPTDQDKKRMEGLLRAWRGQITDQYLDRQDVLNRRGAFQSVEAALEAISRDAPHGAVRYLRDEIERNRVPYFFGNQLSPVWGYDQYFSALLTWEYDHCFGLLSDIMADAGVVGAGRNVTLLAAGRWIMDHRWHGIYKFYNIQFVDRYF